MRSLQRRWPIPREDAVRRPRREHLADLEAEIKAFRDSEEKRLLPIMKAAGIKPE